MNIGCLECGVSSAVVGVFSDKTKAEEIASRCEGNHSWREGGQNAYEVFELPDAEQIAAEYEINMEGD